jgi:hypothetical protein
MLRRSVDDAAHDVRVSFFEEAFRVLPTSVGVLTDDPFRMRRGSFSNDGPSILIFNSEPYAVTWKSRCGASRSTTGH